MDNYTIIQNAALRRSEPERSGFSSLSRVDQADRWAAWQASADLPRADAEDTYQPDFALPAEMPDMFVETEYARRDPGPHECCGESGCALPPPEPEPRRSFALYNEIMARHNQVFGAGQ